MVVLSITAGESERPAIRFCGQPGYPFLWIGQNPVAQLVELRSKSVAVPGSLFGWIDGQSFQFSVCQPSKTSFVFHFFCPPFFSILYYLLMSSNLLLLGE